ncbi:BRO-N domain-containing protein [Azospirillum brasilense]|uniref:BRO-N domain-containing protein n=1 Tax=Azospirillum brasilense TaxID=192 RepID=UPI00190D4C49|nr:BRO family protein [Azospirillum brasilense]
MNAVQTFTFDVDSITHGIRLVEIDGAPWFVAADACKVLGLTNPTVATARLDADERAKLNLGQRGMGAVNAVSESGLYALILQSRKPQAEAFQRWVARDVLPSIRKDGGYIAGQEKLASGELSDAEFLARSHLVALRIIESVTAERDAAHLFDTYALYNVQ